MMHACKNVYLWQIGLYAFLLAIYSNMAGTGSRVGNVLHLDALKSNLYSAKLFCLDALF